jgi:hypothetical protein
MSFLKHPTTKECNDDNTPLPETITLYHSSPVENIESILKFGVTLTKFKLQEALDLIKNSKVPEWRKKEAYHRVMESFETETVCLSGNKNYSVQNGSAGKEWLNYLTGEDQHGDVAVFKLVIPTRILEILTAPSWRSTFERFKELWKTGYFKRVCWVARVNGFSLCCKTIGSYDLWLVTHVPPEYIVSYEIVEKRK